MTYRDIVLRLLKTRTDIVCVESHLLNDFGGNENSGENFADWCHNNGIEYLKLPSADPPRLHLKKKFNYENN